MKVKQTMTLVIEIDSTCTHSPKNIEQALNFYWGSNGTFKVKEVIADRVDIIMDEDNLPKDYRKP